MKLIKLTSLDGKPIFYNIDNPIRFVFQGSDSKGKKYSEVVLCRVNGIDSGTDRFNVRELPEDVAKMVEQAYCEKEDTNDL